MSDSAAKPRYCYAKCADPWFNECADCWRDGGNPAIHKPISFRSMGWFERKLRLFSGSGWNGEHPTGYRWAQWLLAVCERLWWH